MANMKAGADLTDKIGFAVKFDSNGAVVLATDDTAIGILRNDGKQGETVGVAVHCEAVAKAGGIVTAGDQLMADANGKLQKATAGKKVIAVALEKGVAEDLIHVVIDRADVPTAS